MTMHSGERRAERPGLLRDPWTRLALLGALLTFSVPGVHVPATLWAGNLPEFHSAFLAFFGLGLGLVAIGLLVTLAICWLLPRMVRAGFASLLSAVGIVCWGHAYFLSPPMNLLNGVDAPMTFESPLGTWEVPIVAGGCLLLALAIGYGRRMATPMLAMLNAGLFAATIVGVLFAGRSPLRGVAMEVGTTFTYSSRGNVLVLLLDSLQSDTADAALRADPALAQAFDGFAFYKDTMGVAPTTLMTMPAVHAGRVYDGKGPVSDYFHDAILQHSFLTRFTEAGYRAASVEPLLGFCPKGVAACPATTVLVQTRAERIAREAARLFDLALFRIAPVALKRTIYADGNWLVAGTFQRPFDVERIFDGYRLLDALGQKLAVDDGPPTIKFVHLFTTHGPFRMLGDCRAMSPAHDPVNIPTQTHCGLANVAALFERMKAQGVYDQTVILVMADHGYGRDNAYDQHRETETPAEWRLRIAAANPVFLLKTRGARGPLHDAAGSVQLTDVGATLCAAAGACEPPPDTFPAGSASPGRVRQYNDYVWKHEFWTMRDAPAVTPFEVLGPVWERASWRPATPMAPYRLGQPIPLQAADAAKDRYLESGWAVPEPWGRWTSGRVARMALKLDAPPATGGLELVARAWALMPKSAPAQRATWVINGRELDTWRFEPGHTLSEHRVRIPRSVLSPDGDLWISLRISDPVSPHDLQMGDDRRPLGVAFSALALVPAPEDAVDGVVPAPVSGPAITPQQ